MYKMVFRIECYSRQNTFNYELRRRSLTSACKKQHKTWLIESPANSFRVKTQNRSIAFEEKRMQKNAMQERTMELIDGWPKEINQARESRAINFQKPLMALRCSDISGLAKSTREQEGKTLVVQLKRAKIYFRNLTVISATSLSLIHMREFTNAEHESSIYAKCARTLCQGSAGVHQNAIFTMPRDSD